MKQMLSNGEIIIIVGNIHSNKYPLNGPLPYFDSPTILSNFMITTSISIIIHHYELTFHRQFIS